MPAPQRRTKSHRYLPILMFAAFATGAKNTPGRPPGGPARNRCPHASSAAAAMPGSALSERLKKSNAPRSDSCASETSLLEARRHAARIFVVHGAHRECRYDYSSAVRPLCRAENCRRIAPEECIAKLHCRPEALAIQATRRKRASKPTSLDPAHSTVASELPASKFALPCQPEKRSTEKQRAAQAHMPAHPANPTTRPAQASLDRPRSPSALRQQVRCSGRSTAGCFVIWGVTRCDPQRRS